MQLLLVCICLRGLEQGETGNEKFALPSNISLEKKHSDNFSHCYKLNIDFFNCVYTEILKIIKTRNSLVSSKRLKFEGHKNKSNFLVKQ